MACLHTPVLTCLRCMTSWRKVTVWNNLRDVHLKSMNSWEHVSCSLCGSLLAWPMIFQNIFKIFTVFYWFWAILSVKMTNIWQVFFWTRLAVESIGSTFICRDPSSLWDHVPWFQHLWRYSTMATVNKSSQTLHTSVIREAHFVIYIYYNIVMYNRQEGGTIWSISFL